MTDFYAYFEITATVTDRVGAVSAEAARGGTPDPYAVLARVKQPHGAYPRVGDVAVELADVVPHFQAEEFAKHAFMYRPDKGPQPFRCAPDEPAPRVSARSARAAAAADAAAAAARISVPERQPAIDD